ncbi:protein-L-isoaspartate O-methyltransferase family protein [Bailinhaonella thermotolerans]|uniref:Protein-L-isoaspartate O-methyltransferase n=1 Tax=Bailinhaonella thermotolerans TaxID=1070861 RepID=A0A3A4AAZ9_9ACTN|nr:class I SAM-dependent methyltransferase [Bailinhaonella thermotolerans]RJL24007.1 hypothetical protein D5H75_31775 [Bailinhaonella thermotolerans]
MTMHLTESIADRLTAYTADLRDKGAVRTDAVARAFSAVPRHLFIPAVNDRGERIPVGDNPPGELLDLIYSDRSIMTHVPGDEAGGFSSASQPALVAKMLEALRLEPGQRVLEIGAGTGYNAALIATITGAPVVTVDVSRAVADEAARALRRVGITEATALHADGYYGHRDGGPYDRIVVTCGVTGISPHWLDQLAPGGFALVPLAHGGLHPLVAVPAATPHTGGRVGGRAVSHADFMTASGPLYHWPEGRTRLPDAPVPARALDSVPGTGPALEWEDYQALWFHLAARDPRTTRAWTEGLDPAAGMCALHEPGAGTAWIHLDGTARHTGAGSPLDRLRALVGEWDRAGRPAIGDWACAFTLDGAPGQPVLLPTEWHTLSGESPRGDAHPASA